MNTFVNRELKSLELKGIAWLLDTALATRTFVDDKSGDITLYTYAKGGSRKVVWAKHGNKVQRREYQRNRRTNITTLFVDYYQSTPTQDKYLNAAYKTEEYLSDSYFDRAAERAAWNV